MSGDATILYLIDAKRSRFIVRAFAGGLFSAFAHNPSFAIRDFTGEVRLRLDTLEGASLRLTVKADSLEMTDDMNDKDRREIERLMREEVLETSRFPEITFQSTDLSGTKISEGQYRIKITGDLSLHGVTRKCSFDSQVWASVDSLRANGEATLRQTDYNIKLVSAAGGTIKVKDELKFSFDIVANKERE